MSATMLAIETSCDETGVAIVKKKNSHVVTLAQAVASQVDIHAETGGVIPEVAAREHVTVLRPLLKKVMREAKMKPEDLSAIAVTVGPGLPPALAVGVTAARTLAYAWKKPAVPVHHIEGHIYSALLQNEVVFPALALVVSGGHTLLIKVSGHVTYEMIGTTIDDAAGEAFDKVARLLGLGYPGGPALSKLAKTGNDQAFSFPIPLRNNPTLDFSFSGLKTAVLYKVRELEKNDPDALQKHSANIAASFERTVVEALTGKVKKAIERIQPKVLLLAGGVAANERLRKEMSEVSAASHIPLLVAPLELCGDNAIMIGQAATYAFQADRIVPWTALESFARLDLVTMNEYEELTMNA